MRRMGGVAWPETVIMPRNRAARSIQPCAVRRSLLLSRMSARAPAGRARRKKGSIMAVWTMATMKGEGVSVVMSHETPTSCIHAPTRDTTFAIHRVRKKGLARGLHVDRCFFSSEGGIGSGHS